MAIKSLAAAIRTMGTLPAAWGPGIAAGIFLGTGIPIAFQDGLFIAGRLWIIELFVMPFLIAAMFGAMKRRNAAGNHEPGGFLSDGKTYYFPVLLPAVIIGFAMAVTIGLLLVPFSLIGGTGMVMTVIAGAAMGVVLPFVIGTWFYDTAAVFEGRKALDSIRRSVEVSLTHLGKVLLFFVMNALVIGVAGFVMLVAWTSLLYDRLAPIASYNATQLQQFTPAELSAILGTDGAYVTAILGAIWIAFALTFAYSYKAAFYLEIAPEPEADIPEGNYDEKGRWYKYS